MTQSSNTQEFIEKAKEVHGDKYDYFKTNYINNHTKVIIICPIHGEFEQTPNSHLSDRGCYKCRNDKIRNSLSYNTQEFIEKAILVHGDKYDYSKSKYIGCYEDIIITCPIHGEFKQKPSSHLSSRGCFKCTHIVPVDRDKFLSISKEKHINKYDYTKTIFINRKTPVTITCPIHGDFIQFPKNHMSGRGCKKCANEYISKNSTHTTEEFIEKAIKVHGDKYDYSRVNYIRSNLKVIIICPDHGEFLQVADSHLQNHGCPHCKKHSKGEDKLEEILNKLNISYSKEYSIPGSRYRYDFFIPKYNLLLEYDGKQHFIHNSWSGLDGLNDIQKRDSNKNELAIKHGYQLKRISYRDFRHIKKILRKTLTKMTIDNQHLIEKKLSRKHLIAYCDGACRPNPGFGGYGVYGYIYDEVEKNKSTRHPIHPTLYYTENGIGKSKSELNLDITHIVEAIGAINDPTTTNNTAELLAFITALNISNEIIDLTEISILTDSNYIVNAYTESLEKWSTNGWKRVDGKEISHITEWKLIYLLTSKFKTNNITINVNWVKGHNGDYGNEMADMYSVIGSNSSRVQILFKEANTLFMKSVYYKISTFEEYKKSFEQKDFIMYFKDLYFSSNILNDANYCFLSNSDKSSVNIGKKTTQSIFAVNIGFVPNFINKIKEMHRRKQRDYTTTCCIKLNMLDDKEKLRLFNFIDIKYLLVEKSRNVYYLPNDDSPFVYDLVNNFPLIINIYDIFNNINNIQEDVTKGINNSYYMQDITNIFIKDNKFLLTNKINSIDLSDEITDINVKKLFNQKLIINIGYDLPNYLALKQIEEKILKVYIIIEKKEDSNLATCYFRLVTSDREVYVTNITNKFLVK